MSQLVNVKVYTVLDCRNHSTMSHNLENMVRTFNLIQVLLQLSQNLLFIDVHFIWSNMYFIMYVSAMSFSLTTAGLVWLGLSHTLTYTPPPLLTQFMSTAFGQERDGGSSFNGAHSSSSAQRRHCSPVRVFFFFNLLWHTALEVLHS